MNPKILAAIAVAFISPAWSAEPAAKAQPTSYSAPTAAQEQAISQFRNDLMADRADIIAKGLKPAPTRPQSSGRCRDLPERAGRRRRLQVKAVEDVAIISRT